MDGYKAKNSHRGQGDREVVGLNDTTRLVISYFSVLSVLSVAAF